MPSAQAALEIDGEVGAAAVKAGLKRRHADGQWVTIDEAFSGYSTHLTGGIDVLAMGVWQSAKVPGLTRCGKPVGNAWADGAYPATDTRNAIVAYEVKVSRADFRKELYGYQPSPKASWRARATPPWPAKAQWAIDHSHYFVFATPPGLLFDDEIARRVPWGTDTGGADGTLDGIRFDEAPRRGALYLPAGVGLVEVDARGCRVLAAAEPTVAQPWSRHQTFELMRRVEYIARGQKGTSL